MTQLLSYDADGLQHAWDATSISAYEKCPRSYQLGILQAWQPLNKSVHLTFGGHYATALEHFYKYLASGQSEADALRQVVQEILIATWEYEHDEHGNPIPNSGEPWDSLHASKTRETLIRSIVWYFDEFPPSEDPTKTVVLSDGQPAVEYSFALPMDDDITLCGHIDRLVEYNGYYVMDQKTSGNTVTPKFFRDFNPDIQMSTYTYAGKILFDLPVKGVIIDAAQIAVGFTRFTRGFVHKPQPSLDEWYESSMYTIEAARNATRENFFPMTRTSCGNYGGCQFRAICSASPEHRKNYLEADFAQGKRWDPLERR